MMKRTAMVAVLAAVALGAGAAEGEQPRLTGIGFADGGNAVTVYGKGMEGVVYELYWTTNLNAWNYAEYAGETAGPVAAGGDFGVLDEEGKGPGFYRVEQKVPKFLVVDMSGGPDAASWPVSELDGFPGGGWSPEGGWSNAYKTTKLVLRRIPAGPFAMGSPTNELGRADNEPQRSAEISAAFYMGVFEVTQKQWELAMGSIPSGMRGDARPVDWVRFEDIRGRNGGAEWPQGGLHTVDHGSFLYVLRDKTKAAGLNFDLPTEAQWEYACRAGTPTALNSGKDLSDAIACPEMAETGQYGGNRGDGKGGFVEHTVVGCYRPNAWGLYDMHGNVREWCLDWYEDNPSGSGSGTDPVGPATGEKRVLRGGSWINDARFCRSASRTGSTPENRSNITGLRLVTPAP